ncbi:NAD(P)/FAD-dependent oxidoreductase [Flavobacterium sp.]|uniref:NAD(P)/FAD-dependent oxidoreductase n=1 Tax=Flavobacterium sp. TaxID=239 RepID=UPI002628FAE1|nr:NAD(P)/FAD-dependent oxidoreductase [Flavobacterium sp.]
MKKVIIIGGGLAGLTAAIHLSKVKVPVTLIEKNTYPKHKVCGEYISNEVLPYLDWLGVNIAQLQATAISKVHFSTNNGKSIKCELPLGGFGISRFTLDQYLYQKAKDMGCLMLNASVENVSFADEKFTVTLDTSEVLHADIVIGAHGKRSSLDMKLDRGFINRKSPWLAVKAHYELDFPDDLVGLHNFQGGYCGVSKVEGNKINICYLAGYESFKQHRNTAEFERNVLCQNPHLKQILERATPVFEKPITISQVSFESKKCVEDHVLMIGDSAGLIHPLCGNGMAMAIHGAKIASEEVFRYVSDPQYSRKSLEHNYAYNWHENFSKRLKTGKGLAKVLQNQYLSNVLMEIAIRFPSILRYIIRRTHGKILTIENNAA